MRMFGLARAIGSAVVVMAVISTSEAGTKNWKAATTGDWSTAANWVEGAAPLAGDDVIITNAGANAILSTSSPNLTSLVLGRALTFTNWNSILTATTVTIQNNGVMTLPAAFTDVEMSNNVYVACSNFTIDAGGSIDANGKGYVGGTNQSNGYGPGMSRGRQYAGGAGYGGVGGSGFSSWSGMGGVTYGSAINPIAPGSGGGGGYLYEGGSGGGAVRIQASGSIVLNGECRADGTDSSNAYGDAQGGGGSGGGILIVCNSLAGNGSVSVSGGYGYNGGGGGGGRIAVIYDTTAQGALPIPGISFSASPGSSYYTYEYGDLGTLYFPDNRFLTETITNLNGQWVGSSSWSPGSLTISNSSIRFPADGFQLTVTNNVTISGASAKLELGGERFVTNRYLGLYSFTRYNDTNGPTLTVGGNLVLINGGCLSVYSGVTNGSPGQYGASVDVSGDVKIYSNSWIYPCSHPTNGGSVMFSVRNLRIPTPNAGIDATARGYEGEDLNAVTPAYGPGKGDYVRGGGYGGLGGGRPSSGGLTYGSSNAPTLPGSGGGRADNPIRGAREFGRHGGGLVRIEAAGSITVYGSILADGGNGISYNGSGSGGGIYLRCRKFYGGANGLLSADGGTGGYAAGTYGGGGGGRIAVWRVYGSVTGEVPTSVAVGADALGGTDGTVVWGWFPALGTVISVR